MESIKSLESYGISKFEITDILEIGDIAIIYTDSFTFKLNTETNTICIIDDDTLFSDFILEDN